MSSLNVKRLQRTAIIVGCVLAVYALLGFFALPKLVKSQLVEKVSQATGRPVTVGKVSANPFALSLTIRDFVLPDRDGERLLAFDRLYVNFEVSSLWRWAYSFSELSLTAPYLRTLVRQDGSVNFEDAMPVEEPGAPASNEPPLPVLIDHLVIMRGELVYEDRQRTTPFTARLDSLDLSLHDFTTRPNEEGVYQFEAETDRGAQLKWRGDISVVPPRSSGNLALSGFQARTLWAYMQDQVFYEATGGMAEFQADYQLDFAAEPGIFEVHNGSGSLQDLTLIDARDSTAAITIPTLTISGLRAEAHRRMLQIDEIASSGGRLSGVYLPDSTFTLNTLFEPKIDPLAPADSAAPWQVLIKRMVLNDYAMHIEDRTTEPVAQLEIAPLRLTLENYAYEMPGEAQLDLQFAVDGRGLVQLTGAYTPEPLAASFNVKVDTLALRPFQPYLNGIAALDLKSGTLSLAGHTNYALRSDAAATMDFTGDLWLESVRATDRQLKEDFVRWRRLDLKRIKYRDLPASLSIDEITAQRAYLRAIIGPDRFTNIQHVLGTADTVATVDTLQATTPTTPTRIGLVRVVDSELNFSDLSLTPNFSVGILDLNGTIKGLSSEQLARAEVDLNGKVDKHAPALISGQINPLSEQTYTDITLSFHSIELTTFTPYSGKFAGYKIDKGKLNLDLHYTLNDRYLIGENRIVLDQLKLGEKVASEDATSLPVKLAIALMKDKNGVIDLDIPVKGSLDDPEFSLMPIILKTLLNVFVKAVTSPFRLLGKLFGGGGDELEFVSFAPGIDSLSVAQGAKLDSLSRALTERPGLTLEIRGAAALSVDREPLAIRAVTTQIRTNLGTNGVPLNKEERMRLFKLYSETFQEEVFSLVPEKDEEGKKIPREQREAAAIETALQRLVDDYEIPPDELRALAQRRADGIKSRLVLTNSIDETRVYLLDVDTEASPEAGEVRIQLALDAR